MNPLSRMRVITRRRPGIYRRLVLLCRSIVERKFGTRIGRAIGAVGIFKALDNFRVLGGEVGLFAGIIIEVVELPISGSVFLFESGAHRFVREVGNGDLTPIAVEFPDHWFVAFEFVAEEGGSEIGAVDFGWGFYASGRAESREPVGKIRRRVGLAPGFGFAGPADDGGDADAAFVNRAFPAAKVLGGVEEGCIDAADVEFGIAARVGRSVIGGEDDEGVVVESVFFEALQDGADVFIEIRNHRGITGARTWVGKVAVLAAVGAVFVVPFLGVFFGPFVGRMHRDVRLDEGKVEEERFVFV